MVILWVGICLSTKDLFACLLVAFGRRLIGQGWLAYMVNTAYSKGNSKVSFNIHCRLSLHAYVPLRLVFLCLRVPKPFTT